MNDTYANSPCVYMLLCSDGSLYTGWTSNMVKRLRAHNSGTASKYTRSRRPVTPVYLEPVEDRSAALRREAALKKLSAAEKRRLISCSTNMIGSLRGPADEDR